MKNKIFVPILFVLNFICFTSAFSQALKTVDLQTCYSKSLENYPLIKQYDLLSQSKELNLSNTGKNYLPQIAVNGQATYQSEVTQIEIPVAGFPSFDPLTRDQYKIFAEITQLIYDGGATNRQKKNIETGQFIEKQKNDVEIYKIREKVQQMYFGILLLKAQIAQTVTIRKDLDAQRDKIKAALDNGTAYRSNLDLIDAELLKLDQRTIEMRSGVEAFSKMLSIFTALSLNAETDFLMPVNSFVPGLFIKRPELSLFDYQSMLIDKQQDLNETKILPKLSAFLQTGYGKPALNVLKNSFDTYYIGGLKFQWNLSAFYNRSNDKKLSIVNKELIQNQKESFLFNVNLQTEQQNEDIIKLKKLIEIDENLIKLRENIKQTSALQLENGVITTADYLKEWSASDKARQNKLLHEIQLLSAQYLLKFTTGNE